MTLNPNRNRTRTSRMKLTQLDRLTLTAQNNIRKARRTVEHTPPGVVVIEVNHTLGHRDQVKR